MQTRPAGAAGPALEPIATVALEAGRIMMEAGADGRRVEEVVKRMARGLLAERVDVRVGYASLSVTIGVGGSGITRMGRSSPPGVNKQLDQEVWRLAQRVSQRALTTGEASAELARVAAGARRHPPLLTALAVGLACAAFGRLLGIDWHSTGPVLVSSAAAQYLRHMLLLRHVNAFVCATPVSLVASLLTGLGAHWLGSGTINPAMVASTLLLVPGVPAINAQTDFLEGRPTLGTARVMTVVMTLIFAAAGLWLGKAVLDCWYE